MKLPGRNPPIFLLPPPHLTGTGIGRTLVDESHPFQAGANAKLALETQDSAVRSLADIPGSDSFPATGIGMALHPRLTRRG